MSNLRGRAAGTAAASLSFLVEWVCRTATNKSNPTKMNLSAITPEEKHVCKLHILTADRMFHVLDIIAVTSATLAAGSFQAFILLLIE